MYLIYTIMKIFYFHSFAVDKTITILFRLKWLFELNVNNISYIMIENICINKTKVLLSYTQSFNIKHASTVKINV